MVLLVVIVNLVTPFLFTIGINDKIGEFIPEAMDLRSGYRKTGANQKFSFDSTPYQSGDQLGGKIERIGQKYIL